MTLSKTTRLILATSLLCAAANASTIYNFDSDALGTATNFTDTVNGISATFSSPADPGGFVIYPSIYETLSGNVLGSPGPAGADNLSLDVSFSHDLSAVILNFATSDLVTPSPFTLTAYENSTQVGSASSTGMFLNGFDFPEGEISFSDAIFNQLVLSTTAADFAVDNIAIVAAAPEPREALLIGAGLLCLGVLPRRYKRTRN